MAQRFRERMGCDSGIALIEFALVLPLLLLMLIGTLEMARYAIINQKLDKTATSLADFVTQATSVSESDLDSYAEAAAQIMRPFTLSGTIVFSSVTFFSTPIPPCEGTDVSCISWQYAPLGSDASRVGSTGSNAVMPGDYQVNPGQNVIVAEIFLDYAPMLDATGSLVPSLAPHQIYKAAVYKPRQGTLTTLNPD